MKTCETCKGTGVVNRKVWTQGNIPKDVHPAIAARVPAYRTIIQVPCPECSKKGGV